MLVHGGKQVELTGECVLGRKRGCGVIITDPAASRQHARIFLADGHWWVEDLGSANGTVCNGVKLAGRRGLRNGDAICIGQAEVMFCCHERESAPEAAAVSLDPQSLQGRTIAGYVIGRLLGRSGMGFLYSAQQASLQREVAFKVFARKVVVDDPQFSERFRELASKAGSLRHDGFVQLHENGVEDGLVWYSMEMIQGDTLAHLLEREGRFAPELALLACERVATAMAEAHRAGIVHRDIRPRTLMLNHEGKVKILDLGIAAMLGRGRDRNLPENAWYVAADATAKSEPQPADDVYALGCVLYHLLTGQPPFAGATADEVRRAHADAEIPSLRKAVPGLPAKADELFQGMLTKNRDWRQADLAAVATGLRAVRDALAGGGTQGQAQAQQVVGRAMAARRRKDRGVLQAVITVSAIALVGLLVLLLRPDPQPPAPTPTEPVRTYAPPRRLAPPEPGQQRPVIATPVATTDPTLAQVRELRSRLARGPELGWRHLEAEAAQLATTLPPGSPAAVELRLVQSQLAEDAEGWYRAELARLPAPGQGGARLSGLSRLRDESGSAERREAEVLYQEELALLMQRLAEARRQARRALEAGRAGELPALAATLQSAFANTPVTDLQRQFASLCDEAARVAALWNANWRTTAMAFEQQRGEPALAAGAALLLTGDPGRARRILLADPGLGQGELARRREALVKGLAAVVTFDNPGDLEEHLAVQRGEPSIQGGALRGRAGDTVAVLCAVPVGGDDWMADFSLVLAAADAEVVLTCLDARDGTALMLRLAGDQLLIRHAGGEQSPAATVAGTHRLRLTCRNQELRIVLDGRDVAVLPRSPVPHPARLRLELAGSDWRLEEMQVIGSR